MVHVSLMFLSEWPKFPLAPYLAEKKTWWQLASRCCWNFARRLTYLLSASVRRKDLKFGTWTEPSFQRHYRFHPTKWGSRSGYGLISTPSYFDHFVGIQIQVFLNLDTKQRWTDSVKHQSLSPRYPLNRWRRNTRRGMDDIPKINISAAGGNRNWVSCHQGRSVASVQAELLGSIWTDRKQN